MKSVKRIGIMLALILILGSAVAAASTDPVLTLDISLNSQEIFNYTYNDLGGNQKKLYAIILEVWDASNDKNAVATIMYFKNADIRPMNQTIRLVPGHTYHVSLGGFPRGGVPICLFRMPDFTATASGNYVFKKTLTVIPPPPATMTIN